MASGSGLLAIHKNVLDDIGSRFLINLPEEDKGDIMKVCDHLEVAYWFYLDYLRQDDPSLPAGNFEEFLSTVLNHCSYATPPGVRLDSLINQWKSRKYRKPVRGAILLNESMTKCVLVQGYPASSSWGFPKGKINEGERDTDAAVREVYEEVGLDIRASIVEDQFIEIQQSNGQSAMMFIIYDVPETTPFTPHCRKEIKDIQWFNINNLPTHKRDTVSKSSLKLSTNRFFLIIPFISKLKRKIAQAKQLETTTKQRQGEGLASHGYHRQPEGCVPSNSQYYRHYYQCISPSVTWNNFQLNIDAILDSFRQRNNPP